MTLLADKLPTVQQSEVEVYSAVICLMARGLNLGGSYTGLSVPFSEFATRLQKLFSHSPQN